MNNNELCLGCMNPKGNREECPRCGYVEGTPQVLPALAAGTVLAGRYLLGRHTDILGDSVQYIAYDQREQRKVVVREYLPENLCRREKGSDALRVDDGARSVYNDYLADFIDVSRALTRLSNVPSIVPVRDIFECNNTAYAVYDYIEGKPLSELIRRAKRLTWDEAYPVFMPVVSSMAAAHSLGLVHFGLSPETIIMTRAGELKIVGFGVPDARLAETELEAEMYEGFAAIEQYSLEGRKGKWTDVYAMCAVLLYALTGRRPPDAVSRSCEPRLNVPAELAESIPAHVLSAIAGGLQVHPEKRTANMDKLKEELFNRSEERSREGGRVPYGGEMPRRAPENRSANERPRNRSAQQGRPQGNAQSRSRQPQSGGQWDGRQMLNNFTSYASELGGKVSDFFGSKLRSGTKKKQPKEQIDDGSPWYQNLTQWQYALLSTSVTVVVLGTIAVVVFLLVRPYITADVKPQGSTVTIMDNVSATDTVDSTVKYPVPDLLGRKLDTELENEYIMFEFIELGEAYSDDYAEGCIMKQDTPKGTELAGGSPIGVTVSLGSKMCKVPDIIGKTLGQAYDLLDAAGLRLGDTSTEEYSDMYPQGTVIRIVGASVGSSMKRDSEVSVVISKGPSPY